MRIVLLSALFLGSTTAISNAASVVLDFDALPVSLISPGSTLTEDGFDISVVSGGAFGIDGDGNPGNALWIGNFNPVGIGDTFELTRTDGGSFNVGSFEFEGNNGNQSDGVNIIGLFGGGTTGQLLNFSTSTSPYAVQSGAVFGTIDTLRFVGSSVGATSLKLDNFQLETMAAVPLPGAGLSLLAGLAAFGGLRRARRRNTT